MLALPAPPLARLPCSSSSAAPLICLSLSLEAAMAAVLASSTHSSSSVRQAGHLLAMRAPAMRARHRQHTVLEQHCMAHSPEPGGNTVSWHSTQLASWEKGWGWGWAVAAEQAAGEAAAEAAGEAAEEAAEAAAATTGPGRGEGCRGAAEAASLGWGGAGAVAGPGEGVRP